MGVVVFYHVTLEAIGYGLLKKFWPHIIQMLPARFLSQGTFNVETENLVVHEKSVYTLENMKINIRTFQVPLTFFAKKSLKKQKNIERKKNSLQAKLLHQFQINTVYIQYSKVTI